jgi:hypothetical protein
MRASWRAPHVELGDRKGKAYIQGVGALQYRKSRESYLRTGFYVYKFLFDLTDGGNWLVDVHASS